MRSISHISGQPSPGTLFIVSTPIGNLEDITVRALRILKEVDIIAAENVSHTRGLCEHYGIRTRVIRYNQHNQKTRYSELICRLKSGSNIALVTDAGTPGVSDPGGFLINKAASESITISPIPGPSAVTGAISVSGFPGEQYVFCGFLPVKSGKRRQALKKLTSETRTMVFFEAPHRLKGMLGDLLDICGDRPAVIVREMTKLYEEIRRGSVAEILDTLPKGRIKGELTLVVQGMHEPRKSEELPEQLLGRIDALLAEDRMSVRDIACLIAGEGDFPYRRIYRLCLSRKTEHERFRKNNAAGT